MRLYADGRIEFSYSSAAPSKRRRRDRAGICPGRARAVVSFHNDASAEYTAAVVERFGDTQEIDIVAAAQNFYETHEDAYDYLVIYNNMDIAAGAGALAFESTVRSSATGYGVPAEDDGAQYGSASRLRSVLNMGKLEQLSAGSERLGAGAVRGAGYAADGAGARGRPSVPGVCQRSRSGGPGGAAHARVSEASTGASCSTRRRRWMRASRSPIAASGRFVTAAVTQGYAPLDQYLMGFAPASRCARHVRGAEPQRFSAGPSASGVGFDGNRLNISVNDVIQAMGRRTPDHTVAQRRFRFGFILVVPPGSQDSASPAACSRWRPIASSSSRRSPSSPPIWLPPRLR